MTYYYICDACGTFVTIEEAPIPEGQDWECGNCGSSAMWEFTEERAALEHSAHIMRLLEHSAHIMRLVASGLVRRV